MSHTEGTATVSNTRPTMTRAELEAEAKRALEAAEQRLVAARAEVTAAQAKVRPLVIERDQARSAVAAFKIRKPRGRAANVIKATATAEADGA